MSGGHFKYIQYNIEDAADEIEQHIEKYKDVYTLETLVKMKIAAETISKAGKMLQRVDWFISCDDSEDSFNERWVEEGLEYDNI